MQPDPWVEAMRDGRFEDAWAISDAVLAARDPRGCDDSALPFHLRWVWNGTPPDGRQALVRCYHGLGDTLQFARFLPLLRARAARVTLEVQPALSGLLAGAADRVVAFDEAAPQPPEAFSAEIMELGHVLRAAPPAPWRPPVPPALLAAAQARLDHARLEHPMLEYPRLARRAIAQGSALQAGDGQTHQGARGPRAGKPARREGPGRLVGLCWRAGEWQPRRSATLADMLRRLGPGELPVSLQRGLAAAEAGDAFLNPGDDDRSVSMTAALALCCDAVTSVDSMVAHLAASLGVPTTVLLPPDPDWRWMRGASTLWYPDARLESLHRPGQPPAP